MKKSHYIILFVVIAALIMLICGQPGESGKKRWLVSGKRWMYHVSPSPMTRGQLVNTRVNYLVLTKEDGNNLVARTLEVSEDTFNTTETGADFYAPER